MSINLIDVLLACVVVVLVVNGYRRGFLLSTLDLLSWVLSFLAALRFYPALAGWFENNVHWWSDVWNRPIAFVLIGLLVGIIVELVGSALLKYFSDDVHEKQVNRILGLIPGLASGLITAAILSALLLALPLNEALRERSRESQVVNRLAVYTEHLEKLLHPVSTDFAEAIAETFNFLTIRPESDERVTLPYKVTQVRPRPDLESRMLQLVNRERVAAGLQPLSADPELTEVARRHSTDMFARGYFAHDTPEGRDPFARMREAGVRFSTAGENLALAPTVQVAHTGLMNSPGHRANILHRDFGRVGIGIVDGGIRGLMVSQEFRN
ncbi:MAG TPA: CvpA family protein [Pyrinomonadaceae bacterium]|nr:CvpA family protein [Pyrinomonadaceae bacterium]